MTAGYIGSNPIRAAFDFSLNVLYCFWGMSLILRKEEPNMRFASTGTRYVSGVSFTRSGRVQGAGGGGGQGG